MKNKRIPILRAMDIGHKYGWPEIVIFGYDPKTGKQHITTYGKTTEHCKDAARAGNFFKKYLGWPDELCHAKPSRDKG